MLLGSTDGNHRDLSGLDRGVNLRPCHVFEAIIRQHALDLFVVTVAETNLIGLAAKRSCMQHLGDGLIRDIQCGVEHFKT